MKKHQLIWAGIISIIGLIFWLLGGLSAQTLSSAQTTSVVQPAQPDSIVQITAEAQGLQLVAPVDLPETGTFWVMTSDGSLCPNPCPLVDPSLPAYHTNSQ